VSPRRSPGSSDEAVFNRRRGAFAPTGQGDGKLTIVRKEPDQLSKWRKTFKTLSGAKTLTLDSQKKTHV